jgi:WD40 repeat protein
VLQTLPAQVQFRVTSLSWSPEGTRLAWSGGNQEGVQMRSIAGAYAVSALQGKTVRSVAWSPDGGRVACGSQDGLVLLVSA